MTTGNINVAVSATAGTFINPNGVALNYEEDKLYVTSRGYASGDANGDRTIHVFDINDKGVLENHEIFAISDASFADGIKVDRDGRVYGGVLGAVDVYNKDRVLIGSIKVTDGDTAVNMVFVEKTLYMMGRANIYRVELNITFSTKPAMGSTLVEEGHVIAGYINVEASGVEWL
ncbi:unnamed protein product [Clonostachys rosea]|uniref:SMP-30/Gluconolactonase/LRE-like region domain-containing protein n=1 Tax=Bionectria ochroleuca TaxID=29856 RepID=A0ABY6UGF5_BIOOC|nr:unnamed protein product [Clonostachys rosea]